MESGALEQKKFYQMSLAERREWLQSQTLLSVDDMTAWSPENGLSAERADHMIENAVGVFALPLGIARNFVINGRSVLVPMAVEEPSILAGVSFMAKLAQAGGGFSAWANPPEMIAQIQLLDIKDLDAARTQILSHKAELLETLKGLHPTIESLGGGARDLLEVAEDLGSRAKLIGCRDQQHRGDVDNHSQRTNRDHTDQHPADAHDERVDVEIPGQTTADPRDHPILARATQRQPKARVAQTPQIGRPSGEAEHQVDAAGDQKHRQKQRPEGAPERFQPPGQQAEVIQQQHSADQHQQRGPQQRAILLEPLPKIRRWHLLGGSPLGRLLRDEVRKRNVNQQAYA